jgi:hypothetical protein
MFILFGLKKLNQNFSNKKTVLLLNVKVYLNLNIQFAYTW